MDTRLAGSVSVTTERRSKQEPPLEDRLAAAYARCEYLESELELRNAALDAAGYHFVIADARNPRAPTVYVNHAVARDCGYTREEMVGMSLRDFFPPEFNAAQFEEVREALRDRRDVRTELQVRRKDGSTFWASVSITFMRNAQGEITHTVGIGADVTARRAHEQEKRRLQEQLLNEMRERERMAIDLRLAQKLESVGRLAAGIAHEINTPIQYVSDSLHFLQSATAELQMLIMSYQQLMPQLAGGSPTEIPAEIAAREAAADLPFLASEIPKAFERTLAGLERVSSLVRAMKEFAHPDATEHSPADINHALETTLVVSRNEYKYSARLETDLRPLPAVVCNIGELNQVFLNLIVNAAHAIRESGQDAQTGRINVTSELRGEYVVICIEDNGCGIAPENLDKIFDPFFTTKPVGLGTGQGLAIAQSIVVEKHGGTITVESELGRGTRLIVRLPVAGRGATSS
jgi:PAS domain S-box-containing protein